jgi:hypothetical protein
MRDLKDTTGLSAQEVQFLQGIDQYYWAVTKVGESSEDSHRFAYTTGLYFRFRHPELLIYGLPFDSMLQVLNTLANQIRAGKTYNVGIPYKDIFEGRRCRFQPVDKIYYRDRLGAANWFYQSDKYPTLQVFWPDNAGLFPWEKGCDAAVRNLQPQLFGTHLAS